MDITVLFRGGLLVLIIFFLGSCASTSRTTTPSEDTLIDDGYSAVSEKNSALSSYAIRPNAERPSNETLANMIRQLPGVTVAGGNFKVRGADSFYSDTKPLFVLNGRAIGTDFSMLNQTVDPNTVKSIRVLKGPDASIYGTRGANGVIVIKTKG